MKTAILAVILFCVMIFPHELGHFIAAKRMGVKVNEFSFGMGPTIWKKQGMETLYSIRIFPIGGFCAMEGEDEESNDPRAFVNKKPWQKLIVLIAGSFMNLICAILIMTMIVGFMGFTTTIIDSVVEDSPAYISGIESGDKIVSINGSSIDNWNQVTQIISVNKGETLDFTLSDKNGNTKQVSLNPRLTEGTDSTGAVVQRYIVGINCKISHNPFKAFVSGVQSTFNMVKTMFVAIGSLFTGESGADELTGPIGMVQMVSQTAEYGMWYYGFLTALICVNLAIVNMLPLPALDGGRIIFVLYSLITGKKVSDKVEGTIHFVGLGLLLLLMVYVSFNDVLRIIK